MSGYKITSFRDGVSQQRRALLALDPSTVRLEDREVGDLLIIASEFVKLIAYYDRNNLHTGNWSSFLPNESIGSLKELAIKLLETPIEQLGEFPGRNLSPHLSLFLTFLLLLESSKAKINDLTRRHLEFYFKKILGFTPKPGLPDRAHVILELNNTTSSFTIEKGTQFLAGKDLDGQDRVRLQFDVALCPYLIIKSPELFPSPLGANQLSGH